MKKTHSILLSTALLASLGGNAFLASVGLPDALAGKVELRRISPDEAVEIPRDEFGEKTQASLGSGELCDAVEMKFFGVLNGKCTINHLEGWCVRARDAKTGEALDPIEVRPVGQRWTLVSDNED